MACSNYEPRASSHWCRRCGYSLKEHVESEPRIYHPRRDTPIQDNIEANGGKYVGPEKMRIPKQVR